MELTIGNKKLAIRNKQLEISIMELTIGNEEFAIWNKQLAIQSDKSSKLLKSFELFYFSVNIEFILQKCIFEKTRYWVFISNIYH